MNKTRLWVLSVERKTEELKKTHDNILCATELCTEYCWFLEDRHPNKSEESEKISQADEVYLFSPELYLKKVWKLTR